jgi:hypothetical protein
LVIVYGVTQDLREYLLRGSVVMRRKVEGSRKVGSRQERAGGTGDY